MASSLADDAEGLQDDLGSEQQTTHGEPAGQPSDLVAIEVDVALNPSARGPVCGSRTLSACASCDPGQASTPRGEPVVRFRLLQPYDVLDECSAGDAA
jgi:hypothetical protein